MRNFIFLLFMATFCAAQAQNAVLKRGSVTDSIMVRDTVQENFSLYLPTKFTTDREWPIIFVLDMEGHGKRAMSMFIPAAEELGFVLATSNNTRDSLSLTDNLLAVGRMINSSIYLLPISANRIYVAGFSNGARMASLVPTFIKNINGAIMCSAAMANIEILDPRYPLQVVGIVGREDYAYPQMLEQQKRLTAIGISNQLLLFDGGHQWPDQELLRRALKLLELRAWGKGITEPDTLLLNTMYREDLTAVNNSMSGDKPLIADKSLEGLIALYEPLLDTDSLQKNRKIIRRSNLYRTNNRNQNAAFLKEEFLSEDYSYALEEDLATYNYPNLGWWKYQMEQLAEYEDDEFFQKQMGRRLVGYINALVEDALDLLMLEERPDLQAINFAYMLKTILDPKESENYLKIVSLSAYLGDDGTALYYLEELLKLGYKDIDAIYDVEHTTFLRITPEFNALIDKYLEAARYPFIED